MIMNRTLIATSLAIAGVICSMAGSAGLLAQPIGWFAATVLFLLSGTAWWIPFGADKRESLDEGRREQSERDERGRL
jgi:hypothetical protein